MNQYEFAVKSKQTGTNYTVLCTAQTEHKALAAVSDYHASAFTITAKPIAIRTAHYVYGEIDATAI
jgi:hypothetical protein